MKRAENKKRILFCIDSLKHGGAEIILHNMVNELAKDANLDITVQLLQKECSLELDKRIRVLTFMQYNRLYRKFIKWTPAGLLHNIIIKDNYDYEIAFMEGASTKVVSGCRNKNAKRYSWVHTDMGKYQWSKRSYKNFKEEKNSYANIDKVFAVSRDTRDVFSKRFDKQAIYIQNIIDDGLIEKRANEAHNMYQDTGFHIISVGSVKPIKGYERLIKVHKSLKEEGIQCTHYILGDGPSFKELKRKIEEADLQDRIILKGFVENPYPWIKEADLLVCVSYAEGYSSVVSEAVILGVPVITTDCSGMRDILGDSEYGLIVENNDDALLNGMRMLLVDGDKYDHYRIQVKLRRNNFSVIHSLKKLRTELEI